MCTPTRKEFGVSHEPSQSESSDPGRLGFLGMHGGGCKNLYNLSHQDVPSYGAHVLVSLWPPSLVRAMQTAPTVSSRSDWCLVCSRSSGLYGDH